MIKLIASDIDGTLLPYGENELSESLFPLIRRLDRAGILFCPASVRQYHSLRGLFAPVADQLCFLAENGAILYGPGAEDTAPILAKTPMPRREAVELSRAIQALPGCQLLLSGANTSYLCAPPQEYLDFLAQSKGNRVEVLKSPEEMPEEILKVSVYCPKGTAEPQEILGPQWGHLGMAAAGPDWVDFTLADKGTGLRGLCKALGIGLEEVAAFGDNWNDLPMLAAAGQPWLMDSAPAELRRRFSRQCGDVPAVLEDFLRDLKKEPVETSL